MKLPTQDSRLVLLTEGLNGQLGGIQRVSRTVFKAISDSGFPFLVWSSNDSPLIPSPSPNVRFEPFERNYFRMAKSSLLTPLPGKWAGITCWHLCLAPIAAMLSWRLGCPFRVFLHGIEAWDPLSFKVRHALSRAAGFAANSKFTWTQFLEVNPALSNKPGIILPLGLNSEYLSEIAAEPQSAPVVVHGKTMTKPYLLTVTRFGENYKGEEALIRSFAELHTFHPQIQLVCVGEGPLRKKWEALSHQLGLQEFVIFTGRVSDKDLALLHQGSLFFVLLSEREGFGIVHLEAMIHGKPCISTNVDAAQEIVQHGKTGFTVPPRDISATLLAMKNLVENPSLRQSLGEEARQRVLHNHLPEHFEKRVSNFILG